MRERQHAVEGNVVVLHQSANIPSLSSTTEVLPSKIKVDAKLLWQTRLHDDEHANRPKIETWESLKKELKAQYLPCNKIWLAKDALEDLKHINFRDYVMEFSS